MSSPLPIGFFQFDNLVRNRVPFLLLKTNVDVESQFGVMEKMHLRHFSIPLEKMDLIHAQAAMAERHAEKDSPVVVLCEDGVVSMELAKKLCEQGYVNVYYVLDGVNGLREK